MKSTLPKRTPVPQSFRGNGVEPIVRVEAGTPVFIGQGETSLKRDAAGNARGLWNGHSLVTILRFFGNRKYTESDARAAINRVGFHAISDVTIRAQVGSGRAGSEGHKNGPGGWRGELPKLSIEEVEYLLNLIAKPRPIKGAIIEKPSSSTPLAVDLVEPAPRQLSTTYRIIRDTKLAMSVKVFHNHECQICGHTISFPDGSRYSEAHHIRPLGKPHDGHDVLGNIICVCPNHHAELDYGVRSLDLKTLRSVEGHAVCEEYSSYHNEFIHAPRCGPVS